MPKNKKSFMTRENQEASEGLDTTKNPGVPESRYQTQQQVTTVDAGAKQEKPKSGFQAEKIESKGSVLKQEVAARVVDNGIGGEIPATAMRSRSLAYSGNEGDILGSSAYTPVAGQSRSKDAVGKKLDAVAKSLNFIPSEQVEEEFSESKPLAKADNPGQFYNGTVRNTDARKQKNQGCVPGELLFQRSVDEVKRDQLYFTTGQVVYNASESDTNDTPNYVPEMGANGVYSYPTSPNYHLSRSNYLHRMMRIKFDDTGRLTQMTFDVVDATSRAANTTVQNDASANRKIDMNYAEMDRQIMDHKAGDEKAEIWTPLARANKTPTYTVGYLRDIENIAGSEVFSAYKSTNNALAYFHNKAAKDGQKLISPMAEFALGLINPEDTSIRWSNYTTDEIFNIEAYKKGASSLFIAINDSVNKYNNKADLLTQPRSYKLAVQTADNNMNPLRLKSEFIKTLNSREVFSTIDREYDPLSPVCISDRYGLIHCYNFNDLYSFSELDENGNPVFEKTPYFYMYSDLRNNYITQAECFLLSGIHDYLNSIGPKLVSIKGRDSDDHLVTLANTEIEIPMIYSNTVMSLWALIVLAATPFIVRRRINAMKDVLYYEKNVEYPFHQLITIRDANPLNAVNYGCSGMDDVLVVKRMSPSAALSWVLPEVFWPIHEHNAANGYTYVLPWYFNQNEFKFTGTTVERAENVYAMTFPSVRSGARFGYLDDIYSMTERDVRLNLDRLVDVPHSYVRAGAHGVYKYGQNTDGIPTITIPNADFTIQRFISLPRELGWFMVAPAGLLSMMQTAAGVWGWGAADRAVEGASSYRVKYWHGRLPNAGDTPDAILKKTSINVLRNTAFRQDWNCIHATENFGNDADWGFCLSLADIFDTNKSQLLTTGKENYMKLIDNKSGFIPFTNGVTSGNDGEGVYTDGDTFKLMSLQKALWTRIQKLPFAISPFDMRLRKDGGNDDCVKIDAYDFLYCFGLAGFKASDYTVDVYNRSTQVLEQGFNFMEDPFVQASPLFKEAGTMTQSDNASTLVK